MLKEALEFLAGQATKANQIEKIDLPNHKIGVRVGDKFDVHDDDPPIRAHHVTTVESFCRAISDLSGIGDYDPSVWVSLPDVVGLCGDSHREDRVMLPLEKSAQLRALFEDSWFTHKQLVSALRQELRGVFPGTLLDAVRKVDFTRKSDGSTTVEHGRDSLGKKVEAAVQGSADIPEEVMATADVFSNHDIIFKAEIVCVVHIDTENARFAIRPVPDAFAKAHQQAFEYVRGVLQHELSDVPVYIGSP